MMEALREWAMLLAGVMIFGSICESLLPQGGLSKYVRLTVGLLLVLTLIAPVMHWMEKGGGAGGLLETPARSASMQAEDMREKQRQAVIRLYKKKLEEKIKETLAGGIGNHTFTVHCMVNEEEGEQFGEITSVTVVFQAADAYDYTGYVKEQLHKIYGIEEEDTIIKYIVDG